MAVFNAFLAKTPRQRKDAKNTHKGFLCAFAKSFAPLRERLCEN